jgi:hypothetical protein
LVRDGAPGNAILGTPRHHAPTRGVSLTLSLNPKSANEFAFGLQPIIKFIAWQAATLQIDFMCAG